MGLCYTEKHRTNILPPLIRKNNYNIYYKNNNGSYVFKFKNKNAEDFVFILILQCVYEDKTM